MSNYQDSQEEVCENSQTDLFGQDNMPLLRAPPACNSTSHCDCCAKNTILLKEILKEVKQLQAGKTKLPSFSIQNSAVEKPLHEYLKVRFSRNPFLSDPDTELKSKLLTLRRKYAPDADAQEVLRHGLRFAARKMVDFRSQTKNKILSHSVKSEDVGTLDVDSLVKSIYGKFMQEQSEETSNLAVALSLLFSAGVIIAEYVQVDQGGQHWLSALNDLFVTKKDNSEHKMENLWRIFGGPSRAISKISWTIALRTNGEGSVRGKRKESRDTESKFETRPDQTR